VISLLVAEPGTVLTVGANGYGKRTPVEEFPTKGRGTKGVISMRIGERNGEQVGAVLVRPGDEIMLITEAGTLVRTGVDGINGPEPQHPRREADQPRRRQKLAGIERVVALNGDGDDDENDDTSGGGDDGDSSGGEPADV
jgi:DNA gyrase subunit A